MIQNFQCLFLKCCSGLKHAVWFQRATLNDCTAWPLKGEFLIGKLKAGGGGGGAAFKPPLGRKHVKGFKTKSLGQIQKKSRSTSQKTQGTKQSRGFRGKLNHTLVSVLSAHPRRELGNHSSVSNTYLVARDLNMEGKTIWFRKAVFK